MVTTHPADVIHRDIPDLVADALVVEAIEDTVRTIDTRGTNHGVSEKIWSLCQ